MNAFSKPGVLFFFQHKAVVLTKRSDLKEFILSIFKKEKVKLASLNYIFTTDKELLEINRQYLGHDTYTDIITFDLSDEAKSKQAEIYISYERVKENAKTHSSSISKELHRVILHGALHLCGYKDKTAVDKKKMREKEDYYLEKYFFNVSRDTVSL
jgi:probable rRNA maturation factor